MPPRRQITRLCAAFSRPKGSCKFQNNMATRERLHKNQGEILTIKTLKQGLSSSIYRHLLNSYLPM